MSYDIWIEADVGGPEPVQLNVLPYWNYTSNVVPMWRKAMPDTDGLGGLDGLDCRSAAEHLEAGILRMEADPDDYRALNPASGWGDFDSQLKGLYVLLKACRSAPNATVGIWR